MSALDSDGDGSIPVQTILKDATPGSIDSGSPVYPGLTGMRVAHLLDFSRVYTPRPVVVSLVKTSPSTRT